MKKLLLLILILAGVIYINLEDNLMKLDEDIKAKAAEKVCNDSRFAEFGKINIYLDSWDAVVNCSGKTFFAVGKGGIVTAALFNLYPPVQFVEKLEAE